MKIRKFYEADEVMDISNDRITEILSQLSNMSSDLDKKKEEIISLTNEMSNYRSKSKKSNDQIDDSVADMETIDSKLGDIISSIDTISNNLKSYNESGRQYLY
jgi:chromosome segregation ATPase